MLRTMIGQAVVGLLLARVDAINEQEHEKLRLQARLRCDRKVEEFRLRRKIPSGVITDWPRLRSV